MTDAPSTAAAAQAPPEPFEVARGRAPAVVQALETALGELSTVDEAELLAAVAPPVAAGEAPEDLPELLLLERARAIVEGTQLPAEAFAPGKEAVANPTLQVLELTHALCAFVMRGGAGAPPSKGSEYALVWRHPRDGKVYFRAARDRDLLALKIVVEGHGPKQVARELGSTVGFVDELVREAGRRGLVVPAAHRLRRDGAGWSQELESVPGRLRVASTFTLQWHLTHACDLSCKHCYDRTIKKSLPEAAALGFLDELWSFCDARKVRGHVCFSGGNPFFYPHLVPLYAAAVDRGFETSILGNPVSKDELDAIVRLQMPRYFQVSLEGLEEKNDEIRGPGNFRRVVAFLDLLREREIPSAVMLTLTRANLEEMLPLARALAGKVDRLTFNRLSQVGEGKDLAAAPVEAYEAFLREFKAAREEMPFLRMKDNLFNILRAEAEEELIGGCTGFGCGAAFNFLAVLPDGEAHACRKFPSPIGNVLEQPLGEVYESKAAGRYRRGATACDGCELRPGCGGCLAVSYGGEADPLTVRDPYCFFDGAPAL